MEQAYRTPAMRLGPDILPYIMSVIPASRGQIAHLITLRRVCKDFKEAVDNCRDNHEWTGRFSAQAADFRNDVVRFAQVQLPLVLNRGIARMLFEKQWQPLIEGMREYNSDCTTQEIIITRCMQTLTPPAIFNMAMQMVREDDIRELNKCGVPGVVAWAMRSHPKSHLVQRNGCRLLNLIVDEDCQPRLIPYIVGTLAVVIHANMQDVQLLKHCTDLLNTLLTDVDDASNSDGDDASNSDGDDASNSDGDDASNSDGDDASNSDGDDASDVMNMSALIQTVWHHVPNLLIRVMREHIDDYDLQRVVSDVLWSYSGIMEQLQDRTCLQDFAINEAETVLLACAHRHSREKKRDLFDDVERNCLWTMERLMDVDFARMQHVRAAMQASINAAMYERGEESMDAMHRMFCKIMEKLVTSPLETAKMQTFAANSGMVQIHIMYICDPQLIALQKEDDTLAAFELVTLICDGNASTSAQMQQADVVRSIEGASPITPKTAHWHGARDRLVAILG